MERAVIAEVMEEKDVMALEIPSEIPFNVDQLASIENSSQRYFCCRAFAMFNQHANCNRHWGSARAWCIIDLKRQSIIYRFDQDCRKCEQSVLPEFDEEAIRRMAEYAVKTYLRRSGIVEHEPHAYHAYSDDTLDGPHDEQRCAKCRILGYSCQ